MSRDVLRAAADRRSLDRRARRRRIVLGMLDRTSFPSTRRRQSDLGIRGDHVAKRWRPMGIGLEIGRKCQRRGCGSKVAQWRLSGRLACIYCGELLPIGPSNDRIPDDEMLIARAIAALVLGGEWHSALSGRPVVDIYDFSVGVGLREIVAWTPMVDVGVTVRMAAYGAAYGEHDHEQRSHRSIKGATQPRRTARAQRDRRRPRKVRGVPQRAVSRRR